jgi:tetratricopeptide (TPR) repeat protein
MMRLKKTAGAGALIVFSLGSIFAGVAAAAENNSAEGYAKLGGDYFKNGEYKLAAKAWERATRLDSTNPDYRDHLGKAYERMAEQSSFPLFLNAKARRSFARALELQPDHAGAMEDLIELSQQPVGLCEGNLGEASALIDRLQQVDQQAARRERDYWKDARHEEQRPGQRLLCGPEKVARALGDKLLPHPVLKAETPTAPADIALARRNVQDEGFAVR